MKPTPYQEWKAWAEDPDDDRCTQFSDAALRYAIRRYPKIYPRGGYHPCSWWKALIEEARCRPRLAPLLVELKLTGII